MSLAINVGIAKTHLLSRKKQSLIAMLGVTFGIAMFILMISFMQGVNEFLTEVTLSSTPDIRIYNDIRTDYTHSVAADYFDEPNELIMVHHPKPKQVQLNIKNANAIIGDIKRDPAVFAVSPLLTTQVFYTYGPVQINGTIAGVNIEEEARLYGLGKKMVTGKFENLLTSEHGILMGQGLADKLNVRLGDLVTLATPMGTAMRFRIVGTFRIGVGMIDNVKSYVSVAGVQQLLGKDRNYITDINIKLKDMKLAPERAMVYQAKYGYKSDDWQTANASFTASNTIRNVLTIVVSITLLVVAGFGIYNIMNMTIVNKMKDIAILKAQGFAGKDIVQIFLSQSLAIGVVGALVGLFLGFMLSYAISQVPFPRSEFISIKYFPVLFRPQYYIFGVIFGVITTFFAGIMPSIKASKVDPVAILRG